MLTVETIKDKSWIIWGGDRVEKDFVYVFNYIKVSKSINDRKDLTNDCYGRLILCGFDNSEKIEYLDTGRGLLPRGGFFSFIRRICSASKQKDICLGNRNDVRAFYSFCK